VVNDFALASLLLTPIRRWSLFLQNQLARASQSQPVHLVAMCDENLLGSLEKVRRLEHIWLVFALLPGRFGFFRQFAERMVVFKHGFESSRKNLLKLRLSVNKRLTSLRSVVKKGTFRG